MITLCLVLLAGTAFTAAFLPDRAQRVGQESGAVTPERTEEQQASSASELAAVKESTDSAQNSELVENSTQEAPGTTDQSELETPEVVIPVETGKNKTIKTVKTKTETKKRCQETKTETKKQGQETKTERREQNTGSTESKRTKEDWNKAEKNRGAEKGKTQPEQPSKQKSTAPEETNREAVVNEKDEILLPEVP